MTKTSATNRGSGQLAWVLKLALALMRQPRLVPTAIRQATTLAPRGWWRSWPPLPLPAEDYLHFRSVTAYGGDGSEPPETDDVTAWLRWVQAWPTASRE